MLSKDFWKNRKVLVTGHTGFKGTWLCLWLLSMGAEVVGYALSPQNEECIFEKTKLTERLIDIRGDIRDMAFLQKVCDKYQPEIVFHLAAQPIVLTSYEDPVGTYETNVMGTMHVLEAVRHTKSVRAAIFVTTDKCYENKETLCGYKETDPFGGYDPYSSSKACDEILIASYRNSFFSLEMFDEHRKAIASVRAGNVIGGGDWAEHRLVPDCIRAIEAGEPIKIRNRFSIRPWQHVLEPLSGYLLLAERLYADPYTYSGGWNFGPDESAIVTVWEIAQCIVKYMGKGSVEDHSELKLPHEAGKLLLNIDKAKKELLWKPKLDVDTAVKWTVDWYKNRNSSTIYELCIKQIREYEAKS